VYVQERHNYILETLARQGTVTVVELCEQLRVSNMTIRRDLAALEKAHLLRRVHGGAVSLDGRSYEPPFLIRTQEAQAAKKAIAAYAEGFIQEGDSIAIDVGTTTLELARCLAGKRNITVLTASLPVANLLADEPHIRVIVVGGLVRQVEHSLIGNVAAETFARFHVDKAFIGIAGVDLEIGLTEYNLEDAHVKRALIGCGEERILLVDSTKLGRKTFSSVAPLTEIHHIVTDDGIDQQLQMGLEQQGVSVHVVPVGE
jgi:DeoR/GlpR family transcriptional regulator of sugar metabolism